MNVAVLLSGGVDSSVSLAEMIHQGHTVEAFYLKIWLEDELSFLGTCPWQEDLSYAQAVCDAYNVPLHVVSLQREYFEKVVSYTIQEVKVGRTPSPDIFCNQFIKCGVFFDYLHTLEKRFDKVVTGHYAQIKEVPYSSGKVIYELFQGIDPVKDQSYFLSHLSQEQLSRLVFPIGSLTKQEVRQKAIAYNLPTQARKDSQGICFLGKIKFADFIKHYLGEKKGPLKEIETGKEVGHHKGYWFYTIGQRKGIGLSGGPWYVVKKEPATNTIYISRSYFDHDKKRDWCRITNVHWIVPLKEVPTHALVKVRHGEKMYEAAIHSHDNGDLTLSFTVNDQGLAPGQFCVLYQKSLCLGAGMITDYE